jgi:hypothetical protein
LPFKCNLQRYTAVTWLREFVALAGGIGGGGAGGGGGGGGGGEIGGGGGGGRLVGAVQVEFSQPIA